MENKIFQVKGRIISQKREKQNFWHCTILTPQVAKSALAGQFVNIKLSENLEPLLRRPFSIHKVKGNNIEILYEVLGKGTEILSGKKPKEYLDLIGPLGNGFDLRPATRSLRPAILVAGGMGVAPLVFLAKKLRERKTKSEKRKILILVGAKTKNHILCEKEFKRLGCSVKIATDNGSRGFKGYVSELLDKELSAISYQRSAIYACGPRPMLKEVARISKKYNIPAQVSLEEHMACGIGACLGCVVKTKTGFRRVCKEGPVFAADQIIWG